MFKNVGDLNRCQMEIQIVVALISSIAAIIMGVVNLVSSKATLRLNKNNAMEVELLKFELETKRLANANALKEAEREKDYLDKAISDIQEFKDLLNTVINHPRGPVLLCDYINKYDISVAKFSENNINYYTTLNGIGLSAIHKACNIAQGVGLLVANHSEESEYVRLSDKGIEEARNIRADLSQLQVVLRDLKYSALLRTTQ